MRTSEWQQWSTTAVGDVWAAHQTGVLGRIDLDFGCCEVVMGLSVAGVEGDADRSTFRRKLAAAGGQGVLGSKERMSSVPGGSHQPRTWGLPSRAPWQVAEWIKAQMDLLLVVATVPWNWYSTP